MTEAQLQQAVLDLARFRGWMAMHIHDSRKSAGTGWPDLFLLHPRTGQIVVAELKSDRGRLSREQRQWIDAFAVAGVPVHVWRPIHLRSEIPAVLRPADVRSAS